MKRRVRTAPTNPYYTTEPAVGKGLIASKPPVQSASLGNKTPHMVPKRPASTSGMANFERGKKPKAHGIKPPSTAVPATPTKGVAPMPKSGVKAKPKKAHKASFGVNHINKIKPL
jgi:hypothetical protein